MIATAIREAKAGHGPISLRARTPIIVLGDFNAIPGGTKFLAPLVSDKSVATSGRTPLLDWDRTPLADARPRHNGRGLDRYTWRDDLDRFAPGILDRVFYSDSVLTSVNQFVLDTTQMSYGDLVSAGLRSIDVMSDPRAGIHDHFPVVIDVAPRRTGRSR